MGDSNIAELPAGAYFYYGSEAANTSPDSWVFAYDDDHIVGSKVATGVLGDILVHFGNGDIWRRERGEGAPVWNLKGNLLRDQVRSSFNTSYDLKSVTDNTWTAIGENRSIATAQTGDYTTPFEAGNQHVYILINGTTAGGNIVITGTYADVRTGKPIADTETLVIDDTADQRYQTSRRWLEVTSVDISDLSPGIPAAGAGAIPAAGDGAIPAAGAITNDYDIGVIGYLNLGNIDFEITGFRAEFRTDSATADIAVVIEKVQDDGAGKMSIVPMEHMGFDSKAGEGDYLDGIRTGDDSRAFRVRANLAGSGDMVVLQALDYEDYFSNDENIIEAATNDEGIMVRFVGVPTGGIAGIDHGVITLFHKSNAILTIPVVGAAVPAAGEGGIPMAGEGSMPAAG